jgi:predicted NAD/FAD-binding protein
MTDLATNPNTPKRVAIIGTGVAGLTAAFYLTRLTDWEVTVFEALDRVGGHAHSHELVDDCGNPFIVDTGFIVFNDRNYPNFQHLLSAIEVDPHNTEMSFSVSLPRNGRRGAFEYNGASFGGLFAQRRNILNVNFWLLLKDILRFNKLAKASRQSDLGDQTVGEWLDRYGFGRGMVTQYLLPMAGAVWSASPQRIRDFPIQSLFHFLDNHGLLNLSDRPQWCSLRGGSQTYVRPLVNACSATFKTQTAVQQIRSTQDSHTLQTSNGEQHDFNAVVLACHADEALGMLAEPDEIERSILGAFDYSENRVFLHSDERWMPVRRSAWASWNYVGSGEGEDDPIAVSYWMNGLQELTTEQLMIVTLNPPQTPGRVHRELVYRHPQFDLKAFHAQQRHHELQGHRNLWYAGAHWRWGFHEDGVISALWALQSMGVDVPLRDEMENR